MMGYVVGWCGFVFNFCQDLFDCKFPSNSPRTSVFMLKRKHCTENEQ